MPNASEQCAHEAIRKVRKPTTALRFSSHASRAKAWTAVYATPQECAPRASPHRFAPPSNSASWPRRNEPAKCSRWSKCERWTRKPWRYANRLCALLRVRSRPAHAQPLTVEQLLRATCEFNDLRRQPLHACAVCARLLPETAPDDGNFCAHFDWAGVPGAFYDVLSSAAVLAESKTLWPPLYALQFDASDRTRAGARRVHDLLLETDGVDETGVFLCNLCATWLSKPTCGKPPPESIAAIHPPGRAPPWLREPTRAEAACLAQTRNVAYVVLLTTGPDPRSRGFQASTHGTGAHSSLRGHFYCYKLDPGVLQHHLQQRLPSPPHLTVVLTGCHPTAEQLNRLWSVELAFLRQAFRFFHAHSAPFMSVAFDDTAAPAPDNFIVDLSTRGALCRCASVLAAAVHVRRPLCVYAYVSPPRGSCRPRFCQRTRTHSCALGRGLCCARYAVLRSCAPRACACASPLIPCPRSARDCGRRRLARTSRATLANSL